MKRAILTSIVLAGLVVGCTEMDRETFDKLGKRSKVTVFANGVPSKSYASIGEVTHYGDTWSFTDADTGGLVRVSGTVVVEEIR